MHLNCAPWSRRVREFLCLLFCLAGLPAGLVVSAAPARPPLSPVFGDHMVLQRDRPNPVWGWCEPGAEVVVEMAGRSARAVADASGRWEVKLPPPPVGGPYTLRVTGGASAELGDVLVGDVWLCGGQSNMAWGLMDTDDGEAEVARADHPRIRLFRVGQQPAYAPAAVVEGRWEVCAPPAFARERGGFSAVAYHFGRRLQQDLDVPIGLIQDAVGGTPAESWMSPRALDAFPEFGPALSEIERLRGRGVPAYGNFVMHWYDEYDAGARGDAWAAPDFDDSAWATTGLRDGFARLGVADTPAVVWFRREIELPDPLPEGVARVQLGVVEKMDTVYINGRWVGASSWVENPRNHPIAPDVLRPGRNLVVIRVLKVQPDGGFRTEADRLRLVLGDGAVIPLEGAWRAAVSVDARPPHPLPLAYENYPTMPAVLHHGMIAPLAPLALAGVIWYQGEANFTRAHQYRTLLPALIADWRVSFRRDDLPFYIAGLPAFMARRAEPGDDWWAELRDAQALAARTVAHTGLAVTIDTGDADDIHPRDKRPVGERLALLALRETFGRDVVASGPVALSHAREPGAIRIHFSNTEGGLVAKGGRPGGFAIAGADRAWVWADVRIESDSVVVSSPDVPEPVAVRYAWQANPEASLFNGAGLPAGPFRTDDWPLTTEGRR